MSARRVVREAAEVRPPGVLLVEPRAEAHPAGEAGLARRVVEAVHHGLVHAGERALVHPELEVLERLAEDRHGVRHRLEAHRPAPGEVRAGGHVLVRDRRAHDDPRRGRTTATSRLRAGPAPGCPRARASRGRRPASARGGRSRSPSRRTSRGSARGRGPRPCGGSRSGRGARCRRAGSPLSPRPGRGRRAGTARGRSRAGARTRRRSRSSSSRGRARGCRRTRRAAGRPGVSPRAPPSAGASPRDMWSR